MIFLCRVCVPAGVCLDGVMLCGGKVVVCHGGSAPEPGWRGIGFLFPAVAARPWPWTPGVSLQRPTTPAPRRSAASPDVLAARSSVAPPGGFPAVFQVS